jgi:Spy/CpxP family protein refolding chaperone
MAEKLGLTDDQKAQAKAILKAAHEQAKAATDPEAKKKIMRDAFDKVRTTVLTEDQRTKLAELRKERIHARCAKLAEKLGLSDDQKAAAKAIMTQARADAKNAADRDAKKAVFKAAFEKVKTTVLTDAQRDQLAKMKEQRKANHPPKAPEAKPGKTS